MATQSIRRVIDSDLRQVAQLGETVRDFCSAIRLSKLQAFDVELCIVEAVNNAILHAYHNRGGSSVEVEIRVLSGRLRMRVSDQGTPLRHGLPANPAPPDPDRLAECGRGLELIRCLMDEVRYASRKGKNTLTMSLRLPH